MDEEQSQGRLLRRKTTSLEPTAFVKDVDDHIRKLEAESKIKLRESALRYLLWLFGGCVLLTWTVIIFQGFNFKGFNLPETFTRWLGVAVIGELAGSLGLAFSFLFSRKENTKTNR